MRLVELSLALTAAQLQRASKGGVMPRILSLIFDTLDHDGKMFAVRAQFTFGADFSCEIELDAAADLSAGDWPGRLDAAVFNNASGWMQ